MNPDDRADSRTDIPTSTTAGRQPTGTAAGHDVTSRMSGVHDTPPVTEVRETDARHGVRPAKTSAAATFALVFGLTALFCALTALLAPAAAVFGLIGLLLAIAGLKMTRRPGVTGRGLAIGGLVTALLGLLLGLAITAGAAVVVNDEQRLDQLQGWLDDRRADLPSVKQIQSEIPG